MPRQFLVDTLRFDLRAVPAAASVDNPRGEPYRLRSARPPPNIRLKLTSELRIAPAARAHFTWFARSSTGALDSHRRCTEERLTTIA
jgi:hypothetical protein